MSTAVFKDSSPLLQSLKDQDLLDSPNENRSLFLQKIFLTLYIECKCNTNRQMTSI